MPLLFVVFTCCSVHIGQWLSLLFQIFEIVAKYHGDELTISLDPNASHVIQKVVAFHGPEVFEPFVTAYTECIQVV